MEKKALNCFSKALFLLLLVFFIASISSQTAYGEIIIIPNGNYQILTNATYQLPNGFSGTVTIANNVTDVKIIGSDHNHIETNIVVSGGRTVALNLTIENLSIEAPNIFVGSHGIDFGSAGNFVHRLNLSGESTIRGKLWGAGIHVPENISLIIESVPGEVQGIVHAWGGSTGGAGIGGGNYGSVGTITISSGIVKATGGDDGAGIGRGSWGSGGTITISGGTVHAIGGDRGAGIGGGYYVSGGTITISGGTVDARGGDKGAGIGGGAGGSGGTITISGGTVDARGGDRGAGIGGGEVGFGGTITIDGGTVTATGGHYGAGIGGGYYGPGGTIIISNNPTVIATMGMSASADIGNGHESWGVTTIRASSPSGVNLSYIRLDVKNNLDVIPNTTVTANGYNYAVNNEGQTGFFMLREEPKVIVVTHLQHP